MPALKVRDEGRIQRLISLAYFLSTRSEIHIDELGERLGVDRSQVEADLNVLMFCGLPPYSPEQLFDIMIEDDFVSMYFNDVFIAPLRLTEEEKAHIVIALARLQSQSTNDAERKAVSEVAHIIDVSHADVVSIEAPPASFDDVLRDSIISKTPVAITYLSLSSASISERIIEPRGLYTTASVTYVFAFSPDADDFRIFRTDRILDAKLRSDLTLKGTQKKSDNQDISESLGETQLFIDPHDDYVDLYVDPHASWILDSYPHEVVDAKKSLYRFFTPGPYFPARLILANQPYIRYVTGTFSREAILEALDTLHNHMLRTEQGN